MWVMTQQGFYSAIAFDPKKAKQLAPGKAEDVLLIRCRVEVDAERLGIFVGREHEKTKVADYLYRIQVTRQEWGEFLAAESADIDYGNFKDRVKKNQGKERASAYMRVWSALLSLQPWEPFTRTSRYPWREGLWTSRDLWDEPTLADLVDDSFDSPILRGRQDDADADSPTECVRCSEDVGSGDLDVMLCDDCLDAILTTDVSRMDVFDFALYMELT